MGAFVGPAMQQKALLALALLALATVRPAAAQTTTAFPNASGCKAYTCPEGYKYRWNYENQYCLGDGGCDDLYDRDFCCRKTGWPWWGWLLLALGICYCLTLCCCPALLAPLGLGGKKKKKKSKSKRRSDSDSY